MQAATSPPPIHVAIDMDDVTLDFVTSVLTCFKKEYGVDVPYEGAPWGQDIVDFCHHPLLLASGYKSWWDWLRERDWLWATFPAVDGAVGGIKLLRAAGNHMECVTSKPEWAEFNVWRWLARWRVPFEQVTIVHHPERKVDKTPALVMVDDKKQTCEEFAADGRYGVWFDRSGRDESVMLPGVWRARSWVEIVNLVNIIREETSRVVA